MWTKFRHKVAFAILRPILKIYLRIKYGYKTRRYRLEKGPYLLLFNHTTNLDPLMMALSFKGPIYFVTNNDLFNIPFVSRLLKYLANPIPKAKALRDISTVKTCIKVAREGGKIGIAPEGNRTYSGRLAHIDKSIVKLIKLLKIPVVLYNIKGGFGVNPRFSRKLRKGKMFGEINRILSVREIQEYSEEEIYEMVVKGLTVDEVGLNFTYRGEALAENLESVFYVCPVCNDIREMESKGNHFGCKECGLSVEYTENLRFRTEDERFKFETVADYYSYQEEFIRNADVMKITFTDYPIVLKEIVNNLREEILQGSISFNHKELRVWNDKSEIIIKYEDILSFAIVYQNTLIINLEKQTYQVSAGPSFNALKYVHLFYQIRNYKEGVKNGFLGI
ncbi:MAG TPA: lysophospholipid acyltransferase family protein [Bacilli bacterium]